MSKQREAFEKWAAELDCTDSRWELEGHWLAWQASRAAALEEAARIVEKAEDRFIAAHRIRALKEQS